MVKKVHNFYYMALYLIGIILIPLLMIIYTYQRAGQRTYRGITLIFMYGVSFLLMLILTQLFTIFKIYRSGKAGPVLAVLGKTGLHFIFPLVEFFAGFFKLNKDELRDFYITVNNLIVKEENKVYRAEDVLVILPHCIQNNECPIKVTDDINKCKKCGRCKIEDVVDVTKEFSVKSIVVTGGTAARNAIKAQQPKLIVSVACERDLASGIFDVKEIPVIGIINERPFGPCLNTSLDTNRLEEVLNKVVVR